MTIALQEGENFLNIGMVPIMIPSANVTWTITDYDTGAPIVGVSVNLAGEVKYTGSDGKCRFVSILEGDYPLIVSHPDYETLEDIVSFHP